MRSTDTLTTELDGQLLQNHRLERTVWKLLVGVAALFVGLCVSVTLSGVLLGNAGLNKALQLQGKVDSLQTQVDALKGCPLDRADVSQVQLVQCVNDTTTLSQLLSEDLAKLIDDTARLRDAEVGELRAFHSTSCPDGWGEHAGSSGRLLVPRPSGGVIGWQNNASAFGALEEGRVAKHSHPNTVALHDAGHNHNMGTAVGFGTPDGGGPHYPIGPSTGNQPFVQTEIGRTGITATLKNEDNAPADSGRNSLEHYPLVYVLVCQRLVV